MTLPATAEAIYDQLVADAALLAALGTYHVPGETSSRPAIGVMRDGEALPEGTDVAGVELVIRKASEYDPQLLYDGQMLRPPFRLYVVQWAVATGGALGIDVVVRRVLALLPGARSAAVSVPAGYGDAGLEQVVITWVNQTVTL